MKGTLTFGGWITNLFFFTSFDGVLLFRFLKGLVHNLPL